MPLDPEIDTQLSGAHHRIAILQRENAKLSAKLAAYESAIERERKPDWEKWNKDLASKLREIANEVFDKSERNDLQTAARQLDYFTDSFTLKANFVPSELKINELEAKLATCQAQLDFARKELSKFTSGYSTQQTHENQNGL